MRINKYIAQAGVASRRGADELVKAGKVVINGAVMRDPGFDVTEDDIVMVNGKHISASEKLCYYALNKPEGYVTTNSDEKGRPTVLSLMTDVDVRVYPVGRLDYNTSGLLIMTNDGTLANRIAHPRGQVPKTYIARVNAIISRDQIMQLEQGVIIDLPTTGKDGRKGFRQYRTKPAQVKEIEVKSGFSTVEITISEGKNRQVRKMAEAVGLKVLELKRVSIGKVRLGRTKLGTYRKLTAEEIDYLKNC